MTKAERRLFLQLMAAGVAGGLSGVIRGALAADSRGATAGFRQVRGEVTVNGNPAQVGDVVNRGDQVVTGKDAHAVYVVADSAFMQRSNANVSFTASGTASFMRVVTGALLSVFGSGRKEITFPTATAGIRGTGCYVDTSERRTYFCLCYGGVELRPQNGEPLRYSSRHHSNPLWIENGMTQRARVLDHTDAEIIMLEALLGRGSPFPAGSTYS
jgi:hypothetical protein